MWTSPTREQLEEAADEIRSFRHRHPVESQAWSDLVVAEDRIRRLLPDPLEGLRKLMALADPAGNDRERDVV